MHLKKKKEADVLEVPKRVRAEHSELPQTLTGRPSFQHIVKRFDFVKMSDMNRESKQMCFHRISSPVLAPCCHAGMFPKPRFVPFFFFSGMRSQSI